MIAQRGIEGFGLQFSDQAMRTILHCLRYSRLRYILENLTLFQMADMELGGPSEKEALFGFEYSKELD